MSRDIYYLLQQDDKGIKDATGLLSVFFRKVLFDLGVDHRRWSQAIDAYYSPDIRLGMTNEKRLQNRSNTNDTLGKDAITAKAFVLGIHILNPSRIHYRLELTWDESLLFTVDKPTHIEIESRNRKDPLFFMSSKLMHKLNFNHAIWDRLVDRWLDQKEKWFKNPIIRSNEKGNINKGILQKDTYTWSTFCKALSIMGLTQCRLVLRLHWGKKITEHALVFVPLHEIIDSDNENEDAEDRL